MDATTYPCEISNKDGILSVWLPRVNQGAPTTQPPLGGLVAL